MAFNIYDLGPFSQNVRSVSLFLRKLEPFCEDWLEKFCLVAKIQHVFTISIFDVLPNKIHYGCSFALTAGFVIICHAIFRNNEININFDGEILTFFVTLTSPEGLKYNKVLTKSINLTVPINDYIINIIVLIKILLRFECRKRRLNSNKESH